MPYEVHAYDVHAYEVYPHEVHALEVHARKVWGNFWVSHLTNGGRDLSLRNTVLH